ncbi:MAG TPA: hypothetical protein VGB99_11730 [Acidobacteriota bacterium]
MSPLRTALAALALLLAWQRPASALDYQLLAQDLEVMKSIVVASFRGAATPASGQLGTLILRNSCQAVYLEGYGAVFTLELWYRDRPPLPPAARRSSGKGQGSDAEGSAAAASPVTGAELFRELLTMARQRPEQQSLARSAALERFIDLLANHGASIRQLKPNESVTLIGLQTASAPDLPQRVQASARRADLAALQRGELSPDDFKSRVKVLEY